MWRKQKLGFSISPLPRWKRKKENKCACAPEGIQFDDDIFNGLLG
jgi:hypothetical protein